MELLLVVAHPRPDSFNHALAAQVTDAAHTLGARVRLHDLYRDGFDPVLPAADTYTSGEGAAGRLSAPGDPLVQRYRADLAAAEALIVVHPNWWGKPPAIMSGWIDRVLVPGVAYDLPEAAGLPEPRLKLSWALILNTGDTPQEREREAFGDPLEAIWCRCVLGFCGVTRVRRRLYSPLAGSSVEQRGDWLMDARAMATALAADGNATLSR